MGKFLLDFTPSLPKEDLVAGPHEGPYFRAIWNGAFNVSFYYNLISSLAIIIISKKYSSELENSEIYTVTMEFIFGIFPMLIPRYQELSELGDLYGVQYFLCLIFHVFAMIVFSVVLFVLYCASAINKGMCNKMSRRAAWYCVLIGTTIIFANYTFYIHLFEFSKSPYLGMKGYFFGWPFVLMSGGLAFIGGAVAFMNYVMLFKLNKAIWQKISIYGRG